MHIRLASIGLAILLLLASFASASADKPTPGATPPGLTKETPPAHDASSNEKENGRHGLFGTVIGIVGSTLTIRSQTESWAIVVSPNTRLHLPGKQNATLADVAVGARVAVNGTPIAGGLDAKQVAILPSKPTIQHRVGKVTAYAPGSSIAIQTVQGDDETFVLNAQTVIRNIRSGGVAIEDAVTVVSHRDPATNTFTATGIVVHPN